MRYFKIEKLKMNIVLFMRTKNKFNYIIYILKTRGHAPLSPFFF